jgi:DNA-binding CsgD family transcriptional regulator
MLEVSGQGAGFAAQAAARGAQGLTGMAALPLGRSGTRRQGPDLWSHMLMLALDEIDYGLLMVGDDLRVLHANHAGRLELESEHPLVIESGQLRVRAQEDLLPLQEALEGASRRGLRRLLTLGAEGQRCAVSVVPLSTGPDDDANSGCLLVLGKSQFCGSLAVQGFARAHKLSPGEVQVLLALCDGAVPSEIAEAHGVAISTIRTQIASLRAKTRAPSIRDLVRQVAVLPPLVGALRLGAERPRSVVSQGLEQAAARMGGGDFLACLLRAQSI